MNTEHPIADKVLELAQLALLKGQQYMAYNNSLYFIDKEDVRFFSREEDAVAFANDNSSDYDRFNVITFQSVSDILRRIPYGQNLDKQLKLDPDVNGLHNKEGNDFTEALIEHFERKGNQKIQDPKLLNTKTNYMNQKNLDYLKDNLKYAGFGDKLNEQLEKEMAKGGSNFQLTLDTEINRKPFSAVLNFRKSDTSDMYFFNSYHATLERKDGEKVDQAFYLKDGKGITAKEAFNLLDGRAVHKDLTNKDGVEYKAWVQIDFDKRDKNNNHEMKQFHENYGFDLKAAVSKFAVAELSDPSKAESLLQSLQKGNVQSLTIDVKGEAQKMFMEANPQYKTVTLYDEGLKRVPKEELEKYLVKGISPGEAQNIAPSKDKRVNGKLVNLDNEKDQAVRLSPRDEKVGEKGVEMEKAGKKNEQQITGGEGKKSLLPKKALSNGLMDKKRVTKSKGQHIV